MEKYDFVRNCRLRCFDFAANLFVARTALLQMSSGSLTTKWMMQRHFLRYRKPAQSLHISTVSDAQFLKAELDSTRVADVCANPAASAQDYADELRIRVLHGLGR